MKLSSLNSNNLKSSLKFLAVLPAALAAKVRRKQGWIITERPDQARDNGYVFFDYMRKNYPERSVFYVIDKKADDFKKIEKLGNCIQFNSWRHFYYFCLSDVHISAHVGGCNPSHAPLVRWLKKPLGFKDVFLPHGVSYGVSEFCLKKYARLDLFICSGKPEYENVLKNYGYSEKEAAYTGFPRLDSWHDIRVDKKLILVMPTWRLYLAQDPDTKIRETRYYQAWQSFLNNEELHDFLEQNEVRLVFYPHHNMKKYIDAFSSGCRHIEFADEQYDIQELLKSAALLVTDYSSVHFDFAYMNKPVIYYQFDREEFFDRQYKQADFGAERDGFGPVVFEENKLLEELEMSYAEDFVLKEQYYKRMRDFYQIYDDRNCERVYKAICDLENRKV